LRVQSLGEKGIVKYLVTTMKIVFLNNNVMESIKKYKGKLILSGIVLILIICISMGVVLMNKMKSKEKMPQPVASPKTVELKLQHKTEDMGESREASQSASFLLKPSPDELITQLTSLENYNEDVVEARYKGLRVLWPAYFFSIQPTEGSKATVVLDVAEDGFGVVIESDVDISAYPQFRHLDPGKKIWIGGEILAVDRSGTGTIYMKTEHLNPGDNPIPSAK
jgi:hypothetical protein